MRKRFSFLMVAALSLILSAQPLHVRADDGGDGGGGDGGSGDGSGTDSGTGTDSTGTDGTGNGGADDTGGDGPSSGDATTANDAPDSSPSTDPSAPTDQTNADPPSVTFAPESEQTTQNSLTPELDAIQALATTDPRGGFTSVNSSDTDIAGTIPPGVTPSKASVDVAINAVIVSGAQSPWDAIAKAPGVRNVIVTGGLIALGETPIDGELPNGGPQPPWLRLIPDLRLMNGSVLPPVVPNVIDIRLLSCPVEIVYPSGAEERR
jgi:hypothetical protein